ncbi:MAG: hypothetical protein L3K02_05910 [Thermoplasmata archaeon]|nr:hypothetical protein [Thermoplasmata archaeon]
MRRRPRGKRILVCPQCQSGNIVQEAGSITGAVYHCRNCQYIGALVLEIEVDEDGQPLR